MKKFHLLMIAGLSILSGCNQANRGNDSNLGEDRDEAAAESNTDKFAGKRERDAEFVYEIVESNYGEIKLAELGHQKSRNAEVKKIAQTFLTDHSTSLNELKTLAQAKAISVPVEEREQSKQMLEDLGAEGDADFDQAWCDEMIDMHDESIDKFEKRFEDTEDQELKAYINKTLPVLKKHHEDLKACEERLKKSKG